MGIRLAGSLTAPKTIEALTAMIREQGKPKGIRTDNGTEFTSKKLKRWTQEQGILHMFTNKGAPYQNGFVERSKGTYRSEVLDSEVFRSVREAQAITELWIRKYSFARPLKPLLLSSTLRERISIE